MRPTTGIVSGVRVSHERATVDDIEVACATDQRDTAEWLLSHDGVTEAFVLQTCNRAEAYVVTETPSVGRSVLAEYAADVRDDVVVTMDHEASMRHLLRVATGLESLVLGEDQIIGQVRDAYEGAKSLDGIGPVLEDTITKAIHVGERARTETAINEGSVSVGSAAVSLAEAHRDLTGDVALVVGAGEMGRLAAHAFARTDVETLYVANRSLPGAERIAERIAFGDVRPVGLDSLPTCLERADVVVSATGSADYVLDADLLSDSGETLVIDLARPRDVSPAAAALDGVAIHDLDALETVTDETRQRRREAAETVESMIDREFEHLQHQHKRKRADEVIASMYESADQLKRREMETALSRLEANGDFSPAQRDIVESLADALISHLLAAPTRSLREAAANDDWTTINSALRLFNPDFEERYQPSDVTSTGTGEATADDDD